MLYPLLPIPGAPGITSGTSAARRLVTLLLLLLAPGSDRAAAQAISNVDAAAKYAWTENAGWTNWRDAGATGKGAIAGFTALSGFVWAENVGWINLGDGTPANGSTYGNTNGTDSGVNYNLFTTALSGFAWGENIGWISFDTSALGASAAAFDPCTHAMSGLAWSENLGWLNLGGLTPTLKISNPADDLGFGKPGTGGVVPELCYYGVMSTGNMHVVLLRKARPNALTAWYVGFASNPTYFKGGVLVPVPVLLTLTLTTNALGFIAFPAPSGTGSVPADIYLQCAISDPGAVLSISQSNALRVHFLP